MKNKLITEIKVEIYKKIYFYQKNMNSRKRRLTKKVINSITCWSNGSRILQHVVVHQMQQHQLTMISRQLQQTQPNRVQNDKRYKIH